MNNDQLDTILAETLKRDAATLRENEAAAVRVLARLGSLPRQRAQFWRWPGVLLDWQFAPAWPRMAALASCAALGFAIGIAGLGRHPDASAAPYSFVSGADFGAIAMGTGGANGDEP
jgi:hypothetical protein